MATGDEPLSGVANNWCQDFPDTLYQPPLLE
jgi:hypothetical protein